VLAGLAAAFGLSTACGNSSSTGTPSSDAGTNDATSSSSGGSGGGSSAGTSGISSGSAASTSDDSSSSSSGAGSDSGSDGTAGGAFDAEIPDAFPESCGQFTFALNPDAAPHTCAFTPADVACNRNADCEWYIAVGCGCFQPVYGVNKVRTAACSPPPCPPPLAGCPEDASGGYLTQDCQLVDNSPYSRFIDSGTTVAVACVNHQCMTYAAGP
jgi:hypothetical protein